MCLWKHPEGLFSVPLISGAAFRESQFAASSGDILLAVKLEGVLLPGIKEFKYINKSDLFLSDRIM